MTGEKGLEELEAKGLTVELTREQAAGFHEQMRLQNELQLGCEAKKRQFRQANLLSDNRGEMFPGNLANAAWHR